MSFAGKCMELEIIMLSKVRFGKTKIACFFSYVETRPKDKCMNYIYIWPNMNICTHIYTYIWRESIWLYNCVCLRELQRGRRRKENDREWVILKCIASVYEDSIMKLTEDCWTIGEQGHRESISNSEVNLIKVQYMHVWDTTVKLPEQSICT
jgi:hypothetical protein